MSQLKQPSNDPRLAQARDLIISFLEEHEDNAHDGAPCYDERLNAVAYVAHCVGWPAINTNSLTAPEVEAELTRLVALLSEYAIYHIMEKHNVG